ncbi:DUF177 domain-containing protein [Listeria marthii]|uniref:YceD family protein n=1 Tax=Listeria marthii TaxID=529731 RepID=UPI00162A53A7|nr:DUF177 domain-containing protein [Listeria marthii]MBC1997977.1 DUF177 domain-containing protein [Listeria marthii]MBC2012970.1 DUF177 domain-containing protein [Listeria marthii]MBC2072461.1 DUF177 domain-containing protein [Listeria marthii]MBF2363698.1 DUF177 domain-containing protein [Listeria marthii]MBF2502939.1 DUF177 domain-containing protein [Listeria marthii]
MKWSISQLKKYRDSNFTINEKADLKKFFQENNIDVRDASPVQVTGELIVHPEEVTANLTMKGEWTLPCARTLEDVVYPYEVHATETFVKSKEQVLDESWHVMEQDMVDLTPVVEELLLVEIPMQVFSEDALEMSKLPRGNEWEMKTEEGNLLEQIAKEPKVDPRLAGLANFFDEKKED